MLWTWIPLQRHKGGTGLNVSPNFKDSKRVDNLTGLQTNIWEQVLQMVAPGGIVNQKVIIVLHYQVQLLVILHVYFLEMIKHWAGLGMLLKVHFICIKFYRETFKRAIVLP